MHWNKTSCITFDTIKSTKLTKLKMMALVNRRSSCYQVVSVPYFCENIPSKTFVVLKETVSIYTVSFDLLPSQTRQWSRWKPNCSGWRTNNILYHRCVFKFSTNAIHSPSHNTRTLLTTECYAASGERFVDLRNCSSPHILSLGVENSFHCVY